MLRSGHSLKQIYSYFVHNIQCEKEAFIGHLGKGGTFSRLQSVPHCWTGPHPSQTGRPAVPWRSGRWCKVLGRPLHRFCDGKSNQIELEQRYVSCKSSIPVAEIGKPPYVSEPNGEAKAGEEELDGVVPAASVLVHRRVFTEVVVRDVLQSVTLSQAGLCLQKIKFKRWQTFIKYSYLCSSAPCLCPIVMM